jgi:hypothetical protein
MEFTNLLINPLAVFTDFPSLAVVTLMGYHKFDAAAAMPAVVPVHIICKPQEGRDVDAKLPGNLSHALACWRSHPPSQISFDSLAATTYWFCPQTPGYTDEKGATFLKPGVAIITIAKCPAMVYSQLTLFPPQ